MATKNSCVCYISARVVIHFPESEGIQCKLCPCLETYARKQCRLTGEYIADGYLTGGLCPLIPMNEEEENGKQPQYEPI